MKKILAAFMMCMLVLMPLSVSASETIYNSFMEEMITENPDEMNDVLSMLKENELGWGGLPADPADIVAEDIVKLYKFEDSHIVNVYNEKGTLVDNFDEEYRYKYFCDEERSAFEIRKNENDEWAISIADMEVKLRQERFPGQPCNFKEMVADVIDQYPELDTDSVKYIEFDILGTYLVYFISDGTEYLVTYPLDDLQVEFEYGKIFTLSEFIDTIDEFSIFNRTEPLEGYGGADIGVVNETDSTPWYIYLIVGGGVALVVTAVCVIIKRKRITH